MTLRLAFRLKGRIDALTRFDYRRRSSASCRYPPCLELRLVHFLIHHDNADAAIVHPVVSGGYCSPRHMVPFTSREEGSNCVGRGGQCTPGPTFPRRPARPLICVYSPGASGRISCPSNFLTFVNTTVRAGAW